MPIIELENVSKIYNQGQPNEVLALRQVNIAIQRGSIVCLQGASGSGKSTLLSIIGCIFPPTSGRAAIDGRKLSRLPDRFLTIHRRQTIGFIFQQFNILPDLTVWENVAIPLLPLGVPPAKRKAAAMDLLEMMEITNRANFPARQISGGQLQRVAIARALVNEPPIILADEPTAHLDRKLSLNFMTIMERLRDAGKTIIIASHDSLITEHPAVDRIISIADGRIHAA